MVEIDGRGQADRGRAQAQGEKLLGRIVAGDRLAGDPGGGGLPAGG